MSVLRQPGERGGVCVLVVASTLTHVMQRATHTCAATYNARCNGAHVDLQCRCCLLELVGEETTESLSDDTRNGLREGLCASRKYLMVYAADPEKRGREWWWVQGKDAEGLERRHIGVATDR